MAEITDVDNEGGDNLDAPTAEIVRPFGVSAAAPGYIDAGLLEMAERLLAEVKRGEVTALALAWVKPNRAVCVDWTRGSAPANLVVAAVSHLWFRLMATAMDAVDGRGPE